MEKKRGIVVNISWVGTIINYSNEEFNDHKQVTHPMTSLMFSCDEIVNKRFFLHHLISEPDQIILFITHHNKITTHLCQERHKTSKNWITLSAKTRCVSCCVCHSRLPWINKSLSHLAYYCSQETLIKVAGRKKRPLMILLSFDMPLCWSLFHDDQPASSQITHYRKKETE